MNQSRDQILSIVYMGFYVALAIVLSWLNKMFPIIQMPNGGSVELYVIALFIASYHLGWLKGLATAAIFWGVSILFGMNDYMVSFPQTMLDYVIPICVLGMASALPRIKLGNFVISNLFVGIVVTMLIKYASHVLAGVYFWFPEGEAAGSMAAWIYSAWTYNLGYNLATLIAALILTPILINAISKIHSVKLVGLKNE